MIKKVRFGNADTIARKGFAQAFHHMLSVMLTQKRAGDCMEFHMDDGSIQEFRIVSHHVDPHDNSFVVEIEPGTV